MRVAYLDCSTGISGDMTLAALIDVGIDPGLIKRGIEALNIPGVELDVTSVIKGGFRATYVRVNHPEQHAHRHLSDILSMIDGAAQITPSQKDLARRIFSAVAGAEARVHGSTIDKVHFHEVGAVDSIVDIVGAAIGFDLLGADQILCSPIPTGRGQIHIDHGICTVPAPGTAELLVGIPLVDVPIEAELTTPTGAAIVKTVVDRFSHLPEMTIDKVGYGAGTMDFPSRANLLRMFVGTTSESSESDRIYVLETNLDDVSAEIVGHTKQLLLKAGALDVYSTPVHMKKDRPGIVLTVICRQDDREQLESILFDETATFGIRRSIVERSKRSRQMHAVETPWGEVQGKLGWHGHGRPVFSPEFDDCARVASEAGLTVREVFRAANSAFEAEASKLSSPQPTITPGATHHSHDDSHSHDHDHDHRHDHDHDHHH